MATTEQITYSVKEYVKHIQDSWIEKNPNNTIPSEELEAMLLTAEQMFNVYMKRAEAFNKQFS